VAARLLHHTLHCVLHHAHPEQNRSISIQINIQKVQYVKIISLHYIMCSGDTHAHMPHTCINILKFYF